MATSPVEVAATKHWDSVFVSRYYNWHSGSWETIRIHAVRHRREAYR
jgi:hypothetical protein